MEKEELYLKGVDFIEIDRTFLAEDKKTNIEFTAWLKQPKLKLEGYCYRLPFSEAIEFLDYMIKGGVPSNYKIFELKDKAIIVGLHVKESLRSQTVLKDYDKVSHIELTIPGDNLHEVLIELIEKDARILNELTGKFHPLKNLVFNRYNLNISCRMYDEDIGFSTKPIFELVRRNVCVRTLRELEEKDYVVKQSKIGNEWESVLGLSGMEMVPYDVIINKKKIKELYTVPAISRELMIKIFSSAYDLQVSKNVLDAVSQKIFDRGKEIKHDYSNRSRRRGPVEKTVGILPMYTVPTIKDLVRTIRELNDEGIKEWVEVMRKTYGGTVANIANKTLCTIDFKDKANVPLQIKLQSNNVDRKYAIAGIQAHALKNTLAGNQLFMGLFAGKINEVQEAMIFNSRVRIGSYPTDL